MAWSTLDKILTRVADLAAQVDRVAQANFEALATKIAQQSVWQAARFDQQDARFDQQDAQLKDLIARVEGLFRTVVILQDNQTREFADLRHDQNSAFSRLQDAFSRLQDDITVIAKNLSSALQILEKLETAIVPLEAVSLIMTFELEGSIPTGEIGINMPNQNAVLKLGDPPLVAVLHPLDFKGRPATLDGIPVWASSNPQFVTVEPASDGLTAVCTAVDSSGASEITVIGDADLGAGVRQLIAVGTITVPASEAVTMEMEFQPGVSPNPTPPIDLPPIEPLSTFGRNPLSRGR